MTPLYRSRQNPTDIGMLNINKPSGLTSHDVIARVRRLTGQRRVGHAGTLDPMATGVLLVCLGKATRIIEYLTDTNKAYVAQIHLGIVTDTWDAEGQVISERDTSTLSLQAIERALPHFTGHITQTPPMYSAIKHQGRPLYALARKGITIAREPREIEIMRLEIVDWRPPVVTLQVECSKGTYIRSLAYDLGELLGTGGYLSGLTRLAVGRFLLKDAVDLETLMEQGQDGSWRQHLLPLHLALEHMPGVTVDQDAVKRLCFGQEIELASPPDASLCCAYDAQHHLVAILKPTASDGLWRPHKVLASCEQPPEAERQ